MLYEYRSDDSGCLAWMKAAFEETLSRCTPPDARISVERIGERPCSGDVDPARQKDLIARAADAIRSVTGLEPAYTLSSTDCNIPLSVGIPSICIGACIGGQCHTREEWLDTRSLPDGCRLFMEFFKNYRSD